MTRHARRVYVGGLPHGSGEVELAAFFNQAMKRAGALREGAEEAVLGCYINVEKRFCFLEVATVQEATNLLAFDGILFKGEALKLRRPRDFNPHAPHIAQQLTPSPHMELAAIGVVATLVEDGPHKVFIGGIPQSMSEEQVRALVASFGALKAFNLAVDKDTGASKSFAFCEFQQVSETDAAMRGLSSILVCGKQLTVRRSDPKADNDAILRSMLQSRVSRVLGKVGAEEQGGGQVVKLEGIHVPGVWLANHRDDIIAALQAEVSKYGQCTSVSLKAVAGQAGDKPTACEVFVEYGD